MIENNLVVGHELLSAFKLSELEHSINVTNKSVPGFHGITSAMLRNISVPLKHTLPKGFNFIWLCGEKVKLL